jgi:hypothetical protein
MGLRDERCWVNEETKKTLLDHAKELSEFGIGLEESQTLQKSFGDALAVAGLVLQIAESIRPGGLRALVLFLRDLAIPEEEILRLRLDEPEQILTYCRREKEAEKP